MIVSLIVAMDEAGGIGRDNQLPWHLSSDLQRFRRLTLGHHLIIGRKTFLAIGHPLLGRHTIILSRSPDFPSGGWPSGKLPAYREFPTTSTTARSLDEALKRAAVRDEQEAFIGGGGEVFAQALPRARRIYLTRVHTTTASDTFFPPLDWTAWRIASSESYPAGPRDEFATTFMELHRSP